MAQSGGGIILLLRTWVGPASTPAICGDLFTVVPVLMSGLCLGRSVTEVQMQCSCDRQNILQNVYLQENDDEHQHMMRIRIQHHCLTHTHTHTHTPSLSLTHTHALLLARSCTPQLLSVSLSWLSVVAQVLCDQCSAE